MRLGQEEPADVVRKDAEATFALARQLQDPCWEGVAAKVLGLTYLAENRYSEALEWMEQASTLCRRVTDPYVWVEVEVLIAEAEVALEGGDLERAGSVARRAVAEAARGSMDRLLARAEDILATL